jgi:hypothetical protein
MPTRKTLELLWVEGEYAVCRLDPHARLSSMPRGPFMSITRTVDELSVVCLAEEAPEGSRVEGPYALMRVAGSMILGLTGVLASIAAPLAAAQISIFAVATFDTDYLLVRVADRERAAAALVAAGHRFAPA